MSLNTITWRKYSVLVLMIISITAPVIIFNINPIAARMSIGNVLASSIGYIGVMLLFWQYLLGVRFIAAKFVQDLIWINGIHKKIGIYGTLLIFSHPFPLILQNGLARYVPNFDSNYSRFIFLGQIAMIFLAATWFASALLRSRMSFRWWKRFHLMNYFILPLVLLHSLNAGTGVTFIPLLANYFKIAGIAYLAVLVIRISSQFGFFKFKSSIINKVNLTHDVVEIEIAASETLVNSKPGQFLYIQAKPFGENHPFTIAKVDAAKNTISIIPKNSGPFSAFLHQLNVGSSVNIDGPYGVFTREISEQNVVYPVFIAGGIGITPFIRQIDHLVKIDHEFTLLYANKTESDIVLLSEFIELTNVNPKMELVNVLSSQPDYIGEKGLITAELVRKYLGEKLGKSTFFVCGPKSMLKAVRKELKKLDVPKDKVFFEEFAL